MTIINPNSISGIVSVTATSNALHFYESDGDKLNINADLTGNVTGNVTGTTAVSTAGISVPLFMAAKTMCFNFLQQCNSERFCFMCQSDCFQALWMSRKNMSCVLS